MQLLIKIITISNFCVGEGGKYDVRERSGWIAKGNVSPVYYTALCVSTHIPSSSGKYSLAKLSDTHSMMAE